MIWIKASTETGSSVRGVEGGPEFAGNLLCTARGLHRRPNGIKNGVMPKFLLHLLAFTRFVYERVRSSSQDGAHAVGCESNRPVLRYGKRRDRRSPDAQSFQACASARPTP